MLSTFCIPLQQDRIYSIEVNGVINRDESQRTQKLKKCMVKAYGGSDCADTDGVEYNLRDFQVDRNRCMQWSEFVQEEGRHMRLGSVEFVC